jgi:hypothetical protein
LRILPIVLTHEDEPTLEPMTARAAMLTFAYAALLAIGIAAGSGKRGPAYVFGVDRACMGHAGAPFRPVVVSD